MLLRLSLPAKKALSPRLLLFQPVQTMSAKSLPVLDESELKDGEMSFDLSVSVACGLTHCFRKEVDFDQGKGSSLTFGRQDTCDQCLLVPITEHLLLKVYSLTMEE